MAPQSTLHFHLNWAKERIDEMDATLASFEAKAGDVQADVRAKADLALAELRKKRNDFQDTVKKQTEANEVAWTAVKTQLEGEWARFETEVEKYVGSFGQHVKQQQATFKLQAEAQLKAWREAADKIQAAAIDFAAERRNEVNATADRMVADAAAAEEKLLKLTHAGTASWSVLMTALAETRAVFDRANQSAKEAVKKATA